MGGGGLGTATEVMLLQTFCPLCKTHSVKLDLLSINLNMCFGCSKEPSFS